MHGASYETHEKSLLLGCIVCAACAMWIRAWHKQQYANVHQTHSVVHVHNLKENIPDICEVPTQRTRILESYVIYSGIFKTGKIEVLWKVLKLREKIRRSAQGKVMCAV